MYFKIKKADGEVLYLPVKIDRDKWNTIDEQGLVTIVDDIECKGLQQRKVTLHAKNEKHKHCRKDSH